MNLELGTLGGCRGKPSRGPALQTEPRVLEQLQLSINELQLHADLEHRLTAQILACTTEVRHLWMQAKVSVA